MTKNIWDTDTLSTNGQTYFGSGTNPPSVANFTEGTNCTIVKTAGGNQFTHSGSTSGDWVLTHSASASGSTELTFTDLSSTYNTYMVVVDNFVPSVDGNRLSYQTSTNNGSTYDSGTGDYHLRGWFVSTDGTTSTIVSDFVLTNILGSGSSAPGNATNESSSAISWFYNPSATDFLRSTNFYTVINTAGDPQLGSLYSGRSQAVAVNAMRLFCATGTITTAEIRIYGMVA